MPVTALSLRKPVPLGLARRVLDEVHAAPATAGVPETGRILRVRELEPGAFVVDPRHPNLTRDRAARFALDEIVRSVGRSANVRRKLAADLAAGVARAAGMAPEDVTLVFVETARPGVRRRTAAARGIAGRSAPRAAGVSSRIANPARRGRLA